MQPRFPYFKIFAAKSDSATENRYPVSKDTRLLVFSNVPTQQHGEMLEKMIGAVQLDIHTQANIIELTPETPVQLATICRDTNISEVLVFGLPPELLGLHVQWPAYQPLTLGDLRLIFAPSLDQIAETKEMKLQLWQGLQNLYNKPV